MPDRLSFREVLERPDETRAARPDASGSRTRFLLSMPGEIPLPVTAIKTIAGFGTSLRRGSETLDRIARGETVAIELLVPDTRDAVAELGALGVRAQIVDYPNVDVRAIRRRLALTQAEFAIRFGLELDAAQNWEQGHQSPDPAARVLLKVIEQNPAAVDAALAAP